MVLWADLAVTGGAGLIIDKLVATKIKEMLLRFVGGDHVISLNNYRRLLEMNKSISSIGSAKAARKAGIAAFVRTKLRRRIHFHHSNIKSIVAGKSALELFEDLEFWLALRTLLVESFALGKNPTDFWCSIIMDIISQNVAACPMDVVANSGSLEVVEIGAKLMKALPRQHHSKILRVVNSHMMRPLVDDSERGANNGHSSSMPAVVDVEDGGVARAQASGELTATTHAHAKVRWDDHYFCRCHHS